MRRWLAISFGLLAVAGILAFTAALATGNLSYVVTDGISMEPVYHAGDLVVVQRAPAYQVGDIAAYHDLDRGGLVVLHRIVGGNADGFTFKGDHNRSTDPFHPDPGEMLGRAVLHVPQAGAWIARLTSPLGLALIAVAMVAGSGTAVRTRRSSRRSRRHGPRAGLLTGPTPPPGRTPMTTRSIRAAAPWLRTTAASVAGVGVLGIMLGILAWGTPITQMAEVSQPTGRSVTFDYATAVPLTAAYDGIVVRAPAPIFRRVARTVDVGYDYRGDPGSLTVTADLAAPSGWHTSVPVVGLTTITSTPYHGTVRLDLDDLQSRADAAATVTGIASSQVSVALVPHISTAAGTTFAPSLPFTLTKLQLAMAGPPSTLVVEEGASKASVAVARTLGFGRLVLTVPVTRVLAGCLIAAAFVLGLVLLVVLHRSRPAGDGATIRRRYRPLLVNVDPTPEPAGRPVVDVLDFETLTRLAERYGLLILHWSRDGVESFVVHDDSTTYRYHVTTPKPAELAA